MASRATRPRASTDCLSRQPRLLGSPEPGSGRVDPIRLDQPRALPGMELAELRAGVKDAARWEGAERPSRSACAGRSQREIAGPHMDSVADARPGPGALQESEARSAGGVSSARLKQGRDHAPDCSPALSACEKSQAPWRGGLWAFAAATSGQRRSQWADDLSHAFSPRLRTHRQTPPPKPDSAR